MVIKVRTEGPGSDTGAPSFTLRQEGELDGDVCIHSHTGKVAEPFILFRYGPGIERQKHNGKLKTLVQYLKLHTR